MTRKALALCATIVSPVVLGLLMIQAPSLIAVLGLLLLGAGLISSLLLGGALGFPIFLLVLAFGGSEQQAALLAF